jgi:cytidylate kinase
MENFVITIERYCASGGSAVGKMLSEKLDIPLYDSNLFKLASSDSGINEQIFELADENLKNSLFYRVSRSAFDGTPINQDDGNYTADRNLFNYQSKVIKGLADTSSCIIIGRCAGYVLRDRYNVLRVFISAGKESCIENESKRSHITYSEAKQKVEDTHRRRADYCRFYTEHQWSDPGAYDLCLNTDVYTYDQCIDMIIKALEIKLGESFKK